MQLEYFRNEIENASMNNKFLIPKYSLSPDLPIQVLARNIEVHLAYHNNAALFSSLSKNLRKILNSSNSINDKGIDLVFSDGRICQVKYFLRTKIGNDIILKLFGITEGARKQFSFLIPYLLKNQEAKLSKDISRIDELKIEEYSLDFLRKNIPILKQDKTAYSEDVISCLNEIQNQVCQKIVEIIKLKDECWVSTPPASGKSYIILKLLSLLEYEKIAIISPRLCILDEISDLLKQNQINFHRVSTNHKFSPNKNIYLICSDSVDKVKKEKFNYLIYDEAHISNGKSLISSSEKQIYLTATCFEMPDVKIEYSEMLEKKCVCEIEWHFAKFNITPFHENIAKFLFENVIYSKILLNFKNQEEAIFFKNYYSEKFSTNEIGIYTSKYDYDLENFKNNRIRILCHVSRLEMGVNIHDIDTVAFIDPWESSARMRQIIGRGERLHLSKKRADKYICKVLFFVGGEEDKIQKQVDRLNNILNNELKEIFQEDISQDKINVFSVGGDNRDIENDECEFLEKLIYTRFGKSEHLSVLKSEFDYDREYFLKEKCFSLEKYNSLRNYKEDVKNYYSVLNIDSKIFFDLYLNRDIENYPNTYEEFQKKLRKYYQHPIIKGLILRDEIGKDFLYRRITDMFYDIPLNPEEYYKIKKQT